VTRLERACRQHRLVLEEFVEHGDRGPDTPAALDHLAGCRACERDLTELALTVAALRRAGRELRLAPVPEPARPRVVALAVQRRSPWSWRFQVGSLLTGAAIAAVVVLPHVGRPEHPAGISPALVRPPVTATWRVAESRLAAAPDTPSFAAVSGVPPRYPEGLSRPWKEVFPSDATPREFEAL
jgi:hypothetical protein